MPSSSKNKSSESLLSPESPVSSINAPQFSQTIALSGFSWPHDLQSHKPSHPKIIIVIRVEKEFHPIKLQVKFMFREL
jgi:hypothetical protein